MMGIPINHAGRATAQMALSHLPARTSHTFCVENMRTAADFPAGVHPYSMFRLPENETGSLDV